MMYNAVLLILFASLISSPVPEVKVVGALRNIMMDSDLSAHLNLDTLDKTRLYGLGPIAGLKGELMIIDGKVYSTAKDGDALSSQENKVSLASMLVYSTVHHWKAITLTTPVNDYKGLEELVKQMAEKNGYDVEKPFAFRVKATAQKATYHVIDWKEKVEHTSDNHKQFAFTGTFTEKPVELLGFYSKHHKGVFTHHTTNMHIHVFERSSGTVGHLDEVQVDGALTLYLPEQ
jgi:acetolactate decarboxylase